MNKEVRPSLIVVFIVVIAVVIGGLYYRFIGGGSPAARPSENASPYGLPKPGEGFQGPPPGASSGRNTITGEPLPARQ